MTEDSWLNGIDPDPMLLFIADRITDRQLRLFGVACCRRHVDPSEEGDLSDVLDVAERIAEGELDSPQPELAWVKLFQRWNTSPKIRAVLLSSTVGDHEGLFSSGFDSRSGQDEESLLDWVRDSIRSTLQGSGRYFRRIDRSFREAEHLAQSALLREIIGNPFQPIDFDPQWRTSTVLEVGKAIYDNKHFDQLPILADALVDAGCDATAVIEHLHSPGPHVKGCWALDLALGKNWLA